VRPRLRRLTIRFSIGFAIGFALIGVVVVTANACMLRRTSEYVYAADAVVPRREWAIVLGALVKPSGEPSDALRDRLETARGLYADGTVQRIYVSGDGGSGEDAAMAAWLVAHGVPAERIVRDGDGLRTRRTMQNAVAHGIRDAVVCTQRFHLARAVAWARHLDIDAIGYEAPAERLAYPLYRKDQVREAAARTLALFELLID
jgi:vancomycin permeability regulator SanA